MDYPYERALNAAASELKKAKRLLASEIAKYPTPISGCDAQFNRLLSDRTRIADTLRSIDSQPFIPTSRDFGSVASSQQKKSAEL